MRTDYVGIDPGLGCTGAVIFQLVKRMPKIRCTAHFKPPAKVAKDSWPMASEWIVDELEKWLSLNLDGLPISVAIEGHFVNKFGPQPALKQAELVGRMLHMVKSRFQCPVTRPAPTEAKRALTGHGAAQKSMMIKCANAFTSWTPGQFKYQNEAIADAIGVGLAGARMAETERKLRRA